MTTIPWFKRPYYTLVNALDLNGSDGRASFAKLMAVAVLILEPPAVLGVAVLAASFGRSIFGTFLQRGSFNASTQDIRTRIDQTISVRRDDALGIEESK